MNHAQVLGADPSKSVLLLASAGTGKTKVLCDRFVNLVRSGTDPKKILCLTFTNSAAEEMQERIALLSLKNDPGVYELILESKHHLKISTIHSFCMELHTRSTEFFGGISKQIIDPGVRNMLLSRMFDDLVEEFHKVGGIIEESLLTLSDTFSLQHIKKNVLGLVKMGGNFECYLQHFQDHSSMVDYIYTSNCADKNFDKLEAQQAFIKAVDIAFLASFEGKQLDTKWDALLKAFISQEYKLIKEAMLTKTGTPRKSLVSASMSKQHPRLGEYLRQVQELVHSLEEQAGSHHFARVNASYITLCQIIYLQYKQFKADEGLIDYDDIISEATELLKTHPAILYKLDYAIDHILVDESQDLSRTQWELIDLLAEEFFSGLGAKQNNRTVFFVGDIKQSIFGFQGAAPELLERTGKIFAQKAEASRKDFQVVEMNLSYRSEHRIIELVNSTFHGRLESFKAHNTSKEGRGCVYIWPALESSYAKEDGWVLPKKAADNSDPKFILASYIADQVDGWIRGGRVLEAGRVMRQSDIMILVRKRSEYLEILKSALRRKGLNISSSSGVCIGESLLGQDIIALLQHTFFSGDMYNLAGLLKSPFCNLEEEEIFRCFYQATDSASVLSKLSEELQERLKKLTETIKEATSIYTGLSHIIYGMGCIEHFTRRLGSSAREQIDELLIIISKYEERGTYTSVKELIEYLSVVNFSDTNQTDSIRIMTVHAAKGLQAPVVILADAASCNSFDGGEMLVEESGIYFSAGEGIKSQAYTDALERQKAAHAMEDMRLLYVAITRAEKYLYVAGIKGRDYENSWHAIISSNTNALEPEEVLYCKDNLAGRASIDASNYDAINILPKYKRSVYVDTNVLEGEIIHSILEKSHIFSSRKQEESYLDTLYRQFRSHFNKAELSNFFEEARNVVLKYPEFFTASQNILNEQTITVHKSRNGKVESKILRMDKVILEDNKIYVIDFKTDDKQKAAQYAKQLDVYCKHMKEGFPEKEIVGLLLWTKSCKLMEVCKL